MVPSGFSGKNIRKPFAFLFVYILLYLSNSWRNKQSLNRQFLQPSQFPFPNSAWEKFLFIQPWINPAFGVESVIEFADNRLVLRGVAEENTEFAGFGHVGFPEIWDDGQFIRQSLRISSIKVFRS